MKIGILGGGISGLSFARFAQGEFEVEVLESKEIYGGIARTREVEGVAYHPVGGHCFNSKFADVMDYVFGEVLNKNDWHQVSRNAVIKMRGEEVTYPIEYAIKQIAKFDETLALNITTDFLAAKDDGNYSDLEDWFRKKFGETLSDTYFIPYNTKIWNRAPKEMSPAWVDGKLPIPDKNSFFNGLISDVNDKMPHASFYYPNTNNQNTFIDHLAEGVNITCNYKVNSVSRTKQGKWVVNEEKEYDIIVSTLPLNLIPSLIQNTPSEVLEHARNLKYNKVTTMLWETEDTDRTWTYIPEADNFFHRYIHIGSFYSPKRNVSITEVVGEKTYEEMVENGKKDSFLKRPMAYNVSDHAYVVFDDNYEQATSNVKSYLNDVGIHTLGRFGEWQYYNMDVCIKRSMEMAAYVKSKYSK